MTHKSNSISVMETGYHFKNGTSWSIINVTALIIAMMLVFTCCKEEDGFVAVSNISGVPTVAEVNSPLTLTATISPSGATNQTIAWTVKNAGAKPTQALPAEIP